MMKMLEKLKVFDAVEGEPELSPCGNQSLNHTKPCVSAGLKCTNDCLTTKI